MKLENQFDGRIIMFVLDTVRMSSAPSRSPTVLHFVGPERISYKLSSGIK